jgi:succinoglycan biosynthesis transport protein ExoP
LTSGEQGDARAYMMLLWRWKVLVAVILVVIPTAAYTYVSNQPKVFESSVLMQVQQVTVDTSLFAETPPPQAQVLASAARLITTSGVAQAAAKELGEPRTSARRLLRGVSATADKDAGFVTIAARDATPERAADVANAFAAAVVVTRRDQAVGRLNMTIGRISQQLDKLRQEDRDGRTQLSEQLQRLRALRAAQGNNATVVEPAVASSMPISPRVTRTVVLAFIVAMLLAGGAVVVVQGADRRLRDPLELERLTDGPLLSVIPASAFSDHRLSPAGEEAFQTLRASLTYFNVDQPVSSVLISSPAQGDGKTTVATNLARAMAHAGTDVILVDADLRRPRVAQRLHLDHTLGLGAVLINEIEVERALVGVDDSDEEGTGRLRVLPSGAPPPNPSALLASQRMKTLIEQLTTMSDLVIIDSTPLLLVSDSLPLVEFVSGVVAVARLNKTTTDAMNRFQRVIANAGGTLLGTVASGATGSDAYGYGYGGYALPDDPSSGRSRLRRLGSRFAREERTKAPTKKVAPRKNIEPTREAP